MYDEILQTTHSCSVHISQCQFASRLLCGTYILRRERVVFRIQPHLTPEYYISTVQHPRRETIWSSLTFTLYHVHVINATLVNTFRGVGLYQASTTRESSNLGRAMPNPVPRDDPSEYQKLLGNDRKAWRKACVGIRTCSSPRQLTDAFGTVVRSRSDRNYVQRPVLRLESSFCRLANPQ